MKIAIIGSGYVGLVSGACLADFGHDVTCIDVNPEKIAKLNEGEIPIFEPGLDELVRSNVRYGRLSFTTDLAAPVHDAEAVFIAVGTPSRRGDGHADLTYVYQAVRDVAAAVTYGWGMIPVAVTIGGTTLTTALWPKDGSYVVPLKEALRKPESIRLGDIVTVRLEIDV